MTPEQRIAEFLRQRENQRGLDLEEICTVYTDPNADPAPLLASDLRAVLAELKRLRKRDAR